MRTVLALLLMLPSFATSSQRLYNCEDRDVVPCYTYDEGEWRVVRSYAPYRYGKVKLCKPKRIDYPCLGSADSKNRRKHYKIG